MHVFGSNTGIGSSRGVSAIPVSAPDIVLGYSIRVRKLFKWDFKVGGTLCLWFTVFVDIQPLDPDHPKVGEKTRLLILTELIESIEINSMWESTDCLHIVRLSMEHTVEFELDSKKMLEGRTNASWGFEDATTHEKAKAA